MISLKEFADKLNGRQYNYPQFTKEEIELAKSNDFVIVYGASDDLIEFDGAIYDEGDCFDGGKVYLTPEGVVCDDTDKAVEINVKWCKDKNEDGKIITWTYDIPFRHETFMIYEDDEIYCRGVVFDINDLKEKCGENNHG